MQKYLLKILRVAKKTWNPEKSGILNKNAEKTLILNNFYMLRSKILIDLTQKVYGKDKKNFVI